MAGKRCPNCDKQSLFTKGNTMECKCGFQANVPPNNGRGGRGEYCVNCGHYKVRNNTCGNCGTTYKYPKT